MTEQDSQEIRLCALVLSVVAFFLFIAAEIVHDNAYACRAVILLVATGALGFAWIGPLTLLAGTLRSKKFQWWQPFQGGVEFVWMQAFGWCLHTFVLTASVVVLANSQLPKWFEGQYLFLGVTGFIAQILLNLSIGCFREVDTEQPAFQLPLNAKTVVSLLVSGSGLLLFVFYDLFSHLGQSPVVIAVGCVEFIASALVIHVFYGCADIPGYRIWQPFEGERTFLLLQYFGWQLFAFTIGGAMNLFCSANDMSGYGSSKGTATAIGTMGMTSQILLLVSLQYFDKGSASQTSKASPSDHAAQPTGLLPLNHITSKTKTKLPAEIYVTSMLCSGALAVGLLSYTSRAKIGVAPEQIEQFFLAHEKVGWIISLCSLAIAAPISNMGGVRSKPQYSWWQPFQGGTKFVFLQTLGWLWYGFYLALSIVLCMNSPKFGELIGCFVLLVGAGSAGAIALSLSYFEPQDLKTTKARDSNQVLYWCDATKGEVAMVVLLSMSSMLFHLLVDFFQDLIYWSSVFFRFRGIQLLTGLLYFVSQMLLLYSLPFFEVTKSHVKAIVRGKPRLQNEIRRKAEDLVNQYFVGRLLGFSACCVFVLVDFTMLHVGPSIPMFPATICAVLGLFSSIPLTYKFATSTYGPKAKSISGSIVFIVLGCALWSFTLLLGALFSYQLWSTQAIDRSMPRSENAPTQFMGTFTGSVGFMAQLLFFQASESSLLKQGPKGEVSSEENLVMVMTKLKKNLKCASIWVYSAITLVSGLVYAHTKSVIPKHLATTQVLGLVFCCVVVIWSAWCIQQQIISSGGGIVQYSKCFAVSQDCESDIVTKQIPILDVGLDCYAQLVAFLTVSEIVGMSTTCKTAHAFHTDALWRQIFARRYGGSHMDRTLLKLKTADTRGYEDTNENAITVRTKPFAATSLHRMETTVLNMVCGLEFPTIQPAPPKSAIISMQSKWKTFCIGREKHFRFDQCKVCKTVEAFSSAPQLWEMQENCARRSPSTWVNLCHCVNPVTLRHEKAHRGCLEILRKQYHATEPHPRPQRMEIEYCASCELGITEVGRLPNTIRELLQVTWEHFCAPEHEFGGGFFSFVPCSASIFIFALKSVGWGSCSMYIWLVTVVALCFVVNSPRFDRALAQIGGEESPSYQAYQRTYYALVLSSIAHLAWCCPTVNQSDAMRNPSLTQTLILLGFRVNFGIFLILALTCFFVFWRTQYRISTVRGVDEASLSESANAQSIAPSADKSCVLCLLKLCSEDRG
uniref:Uncharacterized protein n=1 Tax=Globisporangium ultimum (strain ATCC 200006 / CBS 805.95 / DAOM BR144) TaxID=431595 RepID=K3WGG5_GLOUD